MSKFKQNYVVKSIDTSTYNMPSTGKTQKMKTLNLQRMTQDKMTGEWLPALVNGSAKTAVFPIKPDPTQQNEFIDNPIFTAVDVYKAKGALLPIAFKRVDTSDFNFPQDGENAEVRNSLNVSVFIDETLSDDEIENQLIGQALWQLRTLGVTIFNEFGDVANYKNRKGEIEPAISTTPDGQLKKIAEAQERAAKLQARVAAIKAVKAETPAPKAEPRVYDEKVETEKFMTANPNATDDELAEHLMDVEDAINAENGAVAGA